MQIKIHYYLHIFTNYMAYNENTNLNSSYTAGSLDHIHTHSPVSTGQWSCHVMHVFSHAHDG